MKAGRIEQRGLLRVELPPAGTTLVVRGGRDTVEKLRSHAERTARAWALDGQLLLGVSVFAVLGMPLDVLLRRRFASFRTIYLPTAGQLAEHGSEDERGRDTGGGPGSDLSATQIGGSARLNHSRSGSVSMSGFQWIRLWNPLLTGRASVRPTHCQRCV